MNSEERDRLELWVRDHLNSQAGAIGLERMRAIEQLSQQAQAQSRTEPAVPDLWMSAQSSNNHIDTFRSIFDNFYRRPEVRWWSADDRPAQDFSIYERYGAGIMQREMFGYGSDAAPDTNLSYDGKTDERLSFEF